MALPDFDAAGNLPPGIHPATRGEVAACFGYTPARRALVTGLARVLDVLAAAGCRRAWLDGSFVTRSERTLGRDPADFDLCWDIAEVDLAALARREPALDPLRPDRPALRRRYGGDVFFVLEPLSVGLLEGFQRDRDGRPKGLVLLDPREGGARP
ncbi:MAG TPA: hypothetical protein VFW96_06385 [Thermomicrobiales bacterium]|nr:hypothetical protein [Thermomicrobiales bacterium]